MKKALLPLLVIVFIVIISSSVFAASVTRAFSPAAARASPGELVTVAITAAGVPAGEIFTLEDQAPQGWLVSNWQVQGAPRDKVEYRFVAADNRHGWSFAAESSAVTITFDARVPTTAANADYKFDAVYFDSTGQGKNSGVVIVRTITCGDDVCEGGENSDTCVADCPAPAPPQPAPVPPPEPVASQAEKGGAATTTIGFAVLVAIVLIGFLIYTIYTKKLKKLP